MPIRALGLALSSPVQAVWEVVTSLENTAWRSDLGCIEGYAPQQARAVDMFPGTGHVECVVLMAKAQ